MCVLGRVRLFATTCTVAHQAPPGKEKHGIFQARILQWVAISFSRGSSQPKDQTRISYVSCIGRWIFFLPLSHMGSRQGGELVCAQSFSHVWLFVTPWTVAHQAPLSMEFSGQEYWNGLLFPTPGDLPDSGIKLGCLALQAVSLPFEPQGKSSPRNKFLVCNSSNQSSQAIGKVQWYLLTFAD